MKMNLKDLVAIDVHTHAETSTRMLPDAAEKEALEARGRYFRYQVKHPTIAQMAAYYRERKMAFVVFTVDHERGMGIGRISNEEVAESAHEHADVAIPFASIDPARGKMGMPGGGGLRLKYSNPIYLDDVAADFPDMPIILAHPSVPWQDEALSVATHKPNVYIDLSGWSPKYFEPKLVQYANTLLKDRILFGSDNPVILPDRWLAEFEKLPIKPEVRPLILKENAAKLLGLA